MNCACVDVLVSLITCVTLPLTLSNHAPDQDQEVAFNRLHTFGVYKVFLVERE